MVIYIKFLCDIVRQKLLPLANVSQSYSKNNTGTVFWDTVYIKMRLFALAIAFFGCLELSMTKFHIYPL